jgi:[ribosomal protein S5]-alanine N-acetyltransferase
MMADLQESWRLKYRIDLRTPRLLLRPLICDDVDWLSGLLSDPQVCQFLLDDAAPLEKARGAAKAMIDLDQIRCRFGVWAIQDNGTGEIHGWAELSKLRPWRGPGDEIALSYVLCRKSWGHGIATEAASRLLRYAFEVHELERVMAVTLAGNLASQRVLEKIGMRFVERAQLSWGPAIVYFGIDAPGPAADRCK